MGRDGLVSHLVLAVLGAVLLFIASGPLHWGPVLDFVGWMWAALLVPAVALGVLAGLLDGALTASTATSANKILAFVFDTAILVPLWWIAIFMLGLSGQIDGQSSDPSTVMVPIVGWLVGPLVLHVVASRFRQHRGTSRGAHSEASAPVAHDQ